MILFLGDETNKPLRTSTGPWTSTRVRSELETLGAVLIERGAPNPGHDGAGMKLSRSGFRGTGTA